MQNIKDWARWLGAAVANEASNGQKYVLAIVYNGHRMIVVGHGEKFVPRDHEKYMSPDVAIVVSTVTTVIPKEEQYTNYWIVNEFVFRPDFRHCCAPMAIELYEGPMPNGKLPECAKNNTMLFSRQYDPAVIARILFDVNCPVIRYKHAATAHAPVMDVYFHHVSR